MKIDDTLEIPTEIKAPWVKRFFKNRLGITVRARGFTNAAKTRYWAEVIVPCSRAPEHLHKLVYTTPMFSNELGNRCMRIVYHGQESLCKQNWGGNIHSHMIAMNNAEFRKLFKGLLEEPLTAIKV